MGSSSPILRTLGGPNGKVLVEEVQVQVPGAFTVFVGGQCRDCFVPPGRKDRIVTKSSVPSRAVRPDPCPISLRITFPSSESGLEASCIAELTQSRLLKALGRGHLRSG